MNSNRMFREGLLAFAAAFALTSSMRAALPHPDHVVVVIMENHSLGQIIGNSAAPNINALAAEGASIVNAAIDPGAIISGSHALRQAADAPANYHVPLSCNQPFSAFPNTVILRGKNETGIGLIEAYKLN